MIKLTPKPEVLEALRKAYPTPPKSAEKALAKYCRVLGAMVFDAQLRGQAEDERKLGLYSISTSALANKGGQIGKNKVRVHSWLAENGCALVQMADKGSNITGLLSKVKLTTWVTMEDPLSINTQAMTDEQAQREIDAFLTGDADSNEALFQHLYPELTGDYTLEFADSLFDRVEVDVESLSAYVTWINTKSDKLTDAQKKSRTRQAKTIIAIAKLLDGIYLQRLKLSAFGRTYYTGVSVQSVPKDLRKAMLGNCWEYDVRSSVIAWKMGYGARWIAEKKPGASVREEFKATLNFLEDKKDLMHTVRLYTFLEDSNVKRDQQLDLLKQAFTAVSFGARLTTKGWRDTGGTWQNPALVSIIKNPEERARFVKDPSVLAFIQEQNKLDDWLIEQVKKDRPEYLRDPNLQTLSGRPSKAKIVAYLYQNNETHAMDVVRAAVEATGRKIIANIHDAVVINKRLGAELKAEIEMLLQAKTHNPYWRLGATQYERFNSTPKEVLDEEQLHRQRMDAEEEKAQLAEKAKRALQAQQAAK
jgi:hypothetical protein